MNDRYTRHMVDFGDLLEKLERKETFLYLLSGSGHAIIIRRDGFGGRGVEMGYNQSLFSNLLYPHKRQVTFLHWGEEWWTPRGRESSCFDSKLEGNYPETALRTWKMKRILPVVQFRWNVIDYRAIFQLLRSYSFTNLG